MGVLPGQRPLGDLFGAQFAALQSLALSQRLIDQLQARSRQQALERYMAELPHRVAQDRNLALIPRCKSGVTTFRTQGHPATAGRDQSRGTETRAGTEQADDAGHAGFATTDLVQIG